MMTKKIGHEAFGETTKLVDDEEELECSFYGTDPFAASP